MTQTDTNSGPRRPFSSRARRSGRAPILLAFSALLGAAIGLGGACGGGVETSNTGSTGSAGSTSGGDCSNVGCAPAPLCSTGCQETCGCCPCAEGDVMSDPQNGSLVCKGGCYEPAMPDGGASDASDEMDCSLVGCGPPPLCGQACSEFCGCCNCAPGEMFMMDGKTFKCSADGECYEPVP
jgi:hypothetical protein